MRRLSYGLVGLAIGFLTACSVVARDGAVATSTAALSAARDEFLRWDAAHQEEIVAQASTREAAETSLVEYRAKRRRVVEGFAVAYSALAVTALDGANYPAALSAVKTVLAIWQDLRDAP